MPWDVFISHASEDKESVARPLAEALKKLGLSVWFDEFELKVGDSLRRSIDTGLSSSRFGIAILSPSFFENHWPQVELDGLAQREVAGRKVILPIWYEIAASEVREYSPTLADRVAINWSEGLAATVERILEVLGVPSRTPKAPSQPDEPVDEEESLVLITPLSPENPKSVFLPSTKIEIAKEIMVDLK